MSKTVKLRNLIFPLKQENAFDAYHAKNLCYDQVITTTTFMSQQTKWAFNAFLKPNCKSEHVIYLPLFNLRLKLPNTKKADSILAWKQFHLQGHSFNKHTKFNIIDKLAYLYSSKETPQEKLVVKENVWIQKQNILFPFGLNQEIS